MNKKNNKKNGFTLIELLAVIIILGILMIIAIPSVTSYINNSRKSAYVDTAKEIISGARNFVNEGKLEMFDTGVTYYLPISCISTENGQKSPYGDFVDEQAFVLVTYTGSGYKYYWVSRDSTGQGIKDPEPVENLDEDDIVSDIAFDYIKTNVTKDGTSNVLVLDKDNCKSFSDGVPTAAKTILKTAQDVNQLNQIPETEIYIFKGGTTNPPANYVKFNGEDWRIIGIYNNQLKIIRVGSNGQPNAPTGFTSINWHTTTTNPGWANSSLKESLNTTYYNTLSDTAKAMIDENGSWDVGPAAYDATASEAYTQATTSKTVESTTHTTPWAGKVGLTASYEFLYATGGGDSCLTKSGYNYNDGICGTAANDWLLNTGFNLWSISPRSDNVYNALYVNRSGLVRSSGMGGSSAAVPVVFLKSDVKIIDGDGTNPENAYILQ